MSLHSTVRCLLRSVALLVSLTGTDFALAAGKPPLPAAHTTREMEGWTVRVDDRLLKGEHAADGARALELLESRLVSITAVVPEKTLTKLRAIVIQLDQSHGDLVPMQYHPDAGWLKENGYSGQLAKCVHIPTVADFLEPQGIHGQPWVVLHELAHGYHDQVLGFEEPRISAAWRKFRDSGKYKSVLTVSGKMHGHYGLTDEKEFFAEMTEAYFGSNDFYPFVAGELKQAEPEIFALMADIWGALPGFAALPSKGPDGNSALAASKPGVAGDPHHSPGLEEALKRLRFPGVTINIKEFCVDIAGKVCLEQGMLELVACTKGTKEHESIVALEASAMHIHTALLLLGAEPGNPAMMRAPAGKNESWVNVPPSGWPVDVLLVFPDKTGKPAEHPISEFITRATSETEAARGAAEPGKGNKFPTHTFLFAGSRLLEDGPGPRKYMSDQSGNVISIVTFGDELLCLPDIHSEQKSALEWQVNAAGLPATGANVTLRLRPQRRPAGKENAPAK